MALIHLMAHVQDSNIIHRAGMESQRWVTSPAQLLLDTGWDDEFLRRPDGESIARTISPGGSADLLAATYILHLMTHEGSDVH